MPVNAQMTTARALMALSLLAATTSTARAQATAARLDSAMRAAERAGFSGVVRVEQGGVVLLERGYGLANREGRVPFTTSTIVQIGSNTKDFTAVAILQLHQAGKVSMNDSVGKYFRAVPADKRGITIRHLLNHRAGFPLGIGGDFEPVGRQALVDSAMRTALLFIPGTRESYSNTGFSLLAAIIEQVTGTTYDRYVQRAILAPLGMRRTGFLLPGFMLSDLAHGYLASGRDNGTMLAKPHAADGPYWNLRGNGGILSTVGDMHAFYTSLFEGDVLMSPATRALMFNPAEPIGLAGSDGVNFFLYDRFPGMRTEMIIASTNAASRAPQVRGALGKVLGLPDPDVGGGGDVARRPGGRPVPDALGKMLGDFVRTLNSGDMASLRAFIAAHFTSGADDPTVDERLGRIGRLRENLGDLAVESIEMFDEGPVEMRLKSSVQGLVVVGVQVGRAAPFLIRGLQVRIGGMKS